MEMKNTQHLEYFKIENFKGLSSLELQDIKQINLILGDNNVGKTSVLEALLFDELPYRFLGNLHTILAYKSDINAYNPNLNYSSFFIGSSEKGIRFSYKFIETEIRTIELEEIESSLLNQKQIAGFLNDNLISIQNIPKKIVKIENVKSIDQPFYTFDFQSHRLKDDANYIPFIKSGIVYQNDLVYFYSRTINSNPKLKKDFLENLSYISDDIYDITIDTTTVPNNQILMVIFKADINPIPLFMMGDGIIRLVRLILEIIVCRNTRLMIDEVDNGIHFSRMKHVWGVLLKVAKKNNTQLFITTHDAECLQSFKNLLEEEEFSDFQKDVTSFTLFRNKENEIDSVNYTFSEFEHAIDYSLNIRG